MNLNNQLITFNNLKMTGKGVTEQRLLPQLTPPLHNVNYRNWFTADDWADCMWAPRHTRHSYFSCSDSKMRSNIFSASKSKNVKHLILSCWRWLRVPKGSGLLILHGDFFLIALNPFHSCSPPHGCILWSKHAHIYCDNIVELKRGATGYGKAEYPLHKRLNWRNLRYVFKNIGQ